MKNTKLI